MRISKFARLLARITIATAAALPAQLLATSGVLAQSGCPSQITAVNVPDVRLYGAPTGAPIGTAAASAIAPGTRVLDCHPNRRLMVKVDNHSVWIDGYAVRTDAPIATGGALPRPQETVGGTRGMTD